MKKKSSALYTELNKQLVLRKAASAENKGNVGMNYREALHKQAAAQQVYEGLCKLAGDEAKAQGLMERIGAWLSENGAKAKEVLSSPEAIRWYKRAGVAVPSAYLAYKGAGLVPGLKDTKLGRAAVAGALGAAAGWKGDVAVDAAAEQAKKLLKRYQDYKARKIKEAEDKAKAAVPGLKSITEKKPEDWLQLKVTEKAEEKPLAFKPAN